MLRSSSDPVRVKICGLSEPAGLEAAVEAGADFVGFVFAASRRQVTPSQAASLIRRLPADRLVRTVGVFVDTDPATIRAVADEAGLDLIQHGGRETVEQVLDCRRPAFKTVRPRLRVQWQRYIPYAEFGIVLHIDSPGSTGGSGVTGNWTVAARLARERQVVLGGGLRPDNLTDAIRVVRPWAVDVSSGVETDGIKDPVKIRQFVRVAKEWRA